MRPSCGLRLSVISRFPRIFKRAISIGASLASKSVRDVRVPSSRILTCNASTPGSKCKSEAPREIAAVSIPSRSLIIGASFSLVEFRAILATSFISDKDTCCPREIKESRFPGLSIFFKASSKSFVDTCLHVNENSPECCKSCNIYGSIGAS